MPAGHGWMIHIVPLGDLREHQTAEPDCWCGPRVDDGLIIHNALDSREAFETGERRPN